MPLSGWMNHHCGRQHGAGHHQSEYHHHGIQCHYWGGHHSG